MKKINLKDNNNPMPNIRLLYVDIGNKLNLVLEVKVVISLMVIVKLDKRVKTNPLKTYLLTLSNFYKITGTVDNLITTNLYYAKTLTKVNVTMGKTVLSLTVKMN